MSKRLGLAALKDQIAAERVPQPPVARAAAPDPQLAGEEGRLIRGKRYPTYREGKVPIGGYFSPELSRVLHQLALDESVLGQPRVKIQALLGEAIDLLLQNRGKHPFGER